MKTTTKRHRTLHALFAAGISISALAAAHAAGVHAIDTIFADFRDLDGLEESCHFARRDGFTGKLAMHNGIDFAGKEGSNVVAVAATDADGLLADFSNYGLGHVDIAGPGVEILSTCPPSEYVGTGLGEGGRRGKRAGVRPSAQRSGRGASGRTGPGVVQTVAG